MSRNEYELKMRFQGDLKQRLADAAMVNSRSLNSEIMLRLEESFRPAGDIPNASGDRPDLGKLIVEMHAEIMGKNEAKQPSTLALLPKLPMGTDSKSGLNFFKPRKPKTPRAT